MDNPYVANVVQTAASVYSAEVDYNSAENIRAAYHRLRGRGSLTDNMAEISSIGRRA